MIANFHTHTEFCDGSGTPEEFVRAAIEKGLSIYGFSSHAPLGEYPCTLMYPNQLKVYTREIKRLKKKYRSRISIMLGLEIDYIPGVMGPDSDRFKNLELDYTVGSVHYVDFLKNGMPMAVDRTTSSFQKGLQEVFAGNFKRLCQRYFELIRQMLQEQPPDILAHMDKISRFNIDGVYFSEDDSWYLEEIERTLEFVKTSGTMIEFNTRGLYTSPQPRPYPSLSILRRIHEMDLPLTINTDAHKPSEINKGYHKALEMIKKIGFKSLALLKEGQIIEVGI